MAEHLSIDGYILWRIKKGKTNLIFADLIESSHGSAHIIKIFDRTAEPLHEAVNKVHDAVHLQGTLVIESLGVRQLPVVGLRDQGQTKALRGKQDRAHSECGLDLFNVLLQTL